MDFKPELNKTEEKYRLKIQEKIVSCPDCEYYDNEERRILWMTGTESDVEDLFFTFNVPEKYWIRIAEHLRCPNCGSEGFGPYSDVGIKSKFDIQVDELVGKAVKLYGKDVQSFEEFLERYPLLAFNHKFGKRIFKELEASILPITSINGYFYRARLVESSDIITSANMGHPPLGKPAEGRFNHAGQSHLYLATDKLTAIKEVVFNEQGRLVWYQKFSISDPVIRILDLSFNWDNLSPSTSTLLLSLKLHNSIGRKDRNNENWKPDYYLTRFIMDCAKMSGYNGIKYNSAVSQYQYDVVLFFPDEVDIKVEGNPAIEIFENKKDVFEPVDI